MIAYSGTDLDVKLAYNAHRNTSFTPEKRAESIISEYIAEMGALLTEFYQFVTPENEASMAADLEQYRLGYIKRLNAYLAARSRCASSMITGPANFPTRRNEKANNTADKRRNEFLDYREKTKRRLRRTYDPKLIAAAPISSDDGQAIEKLQAKIAKAEALQATMKAANAIIRKKKLADEEKVAALIELDGLGEQVARDLLKPDYMGRPGFAAYQLQNNNANIRRMKQRIAQLDADRDRKPVEDKIIDGVTVSENTELNRLQLFFDGKPPAEMRQQLKSRGFRWSPRQGCWQRQLTDNARWAADSLLAN